MAEDIVPEILDKIQREFNSLLGSNAKIKGIYKKISLGTATYADAQDYSIVVGEMLAGLLKKHITLDTLPDGRMYYNIAERLLNTTLGNNHQLISSATKQVQELLNKKAGLGLKSVDVPIQQHKIDGLINKLSSVEDFESVAWVLDAPVLTFSQNVVDAILKGNIDFQGKSGMRPTVTRTVHGFKPCDFCRRLAGTYDYPDVPNEVYTRHDRCKCTVEYDPGDNKKKDFRPDNWKTQEEKEQIEIRKNYGL